MEPSFVFLSFIMLSTRLFQGGEWMTEFFFFSLSVNCSFKAPSAVSPSQTELCAHEHMLPFKQQYVAIVL